MITSSSTFVCLPIVTWLTGFHSRALCLPAVHPWRDPCRRVSGDGMRVEPSLMHHEGGSWTAVRTHTPSKLSKVQRTFVSHPLGLRQVSGERITAPSELIVTLSMSINSPVDDRHWGSGSCASRTLLPFICRRPATLRPAMGSPHPRLLRWLRARGARAR